MGNCERAPSVPWDEFYQPHCLKCSKSCTISKLTFILSLPESGSFSLELQASQGGIKREVKELNVSALSSSLFVRWPNTNGWDLEGKGTPTLG